MKPALWLCLTFLILLAACRPASQVDNPPYPPAQLPGTDSYPPPQLAATIEQGYPPPAVTPTTVSWEEARAAIFEGKVVEAIQLHSLTVYLVLEDGTQLITEEPEIDAVLAVIEECGSLCETIEIITE